MSIRLAQAKFAGRIDRCTKTTGGQFGHQLNQELLSGVIKLLKTATRQLSCATTSGSKTKLTRALCAAMLLTLAACAQRNGPKVHFASATKPQLEAVANESEVWYEFKPGDSIPLHVIIAGVAEGGAKNLSFVAKKPFYIVVTKGRPTRLSFDGETIAYHDAGQTILGLGQVDGKNSLTIVGYVGKKADMPPALREE